MIKNFKIYKKNKNCTSVINISNIRYLKVKSQTSTYKKQYNNILMDFENFKKRYIIEKDNILKSANKNIIIQLLNIVDDLENALISISNKKSFFLPHSKHSLKHIQYGIDLITKNFLKILRLYHVIPIKTLGTTFNPLKHEAIQNHYNKDLEHEIIIEEFQKGYTLYSKLLRASKVAVNIHC